MLVSVAAYHHSKCFGPRLTEQIPRPASVISGSYNDDPLELVFVRAISHKGNFTARRILGSRSGLDRDRRNGHLTQNRFLDFHPPWHSDTETLKKDSRRPTLSKERPGFEGSF